MCIKKWAFLITMTVPFLFTYTANADETCLSPYMAKITGYEDFVYVWTLGAEG
ncbi:partial Methanethiol oxidase, partial [Candidatus Brocadiaceae bacterium]